MLSTLSDGSIAVFDRYSGAVRLFSDELCSEPEYAWDGIISRPFRPCFLSDLLWVPSIVRRTQSIPIFDFQSLSGIEERGVYRIHQFEKQEMIVVCKPEESMDWYDKLWKNTVDLFRSMDIPVRTLECCSGDLADLKVKSVDVEAWSPRQKKYFEVGSCSNLGDAQARRLGIRVKGENGSYFAHTLNNTVVAPPRMLIAFLENNLQADGSVSIPEVLRPYMGGNDKIVPKK